MFTETISRTKKSKATVIVQGQRDWNPTKLNLIYLIFVCLLLLTAFFLSGLYIFKVALYSES